MRRVVLLALGAFALLAAVSFTNVAVFSVNASLPPGMKYAGADACRALAPSGYKVGFYVNTSSLYQGNAVWLKVFDLREACWSRGLSQCTVRPSPLASYTFARPPVEVAADYALFYEDCIACDFNYFDEVWRLTVSSCGVFQLTHYYSAGNLYHRVYVNGTQVYFKGQGVVNSTVFSLYFPGRSITVKFVSGPIYTTDPYASFSTAPGLASAGYFFSSGYNVTYVRVVGFVGDPTVYSSPLRVCNRYVPQLYVRLVAVGAVSSTGLEQYVRRARVYLGGDYVEFSGSSVVKGATGWLAVGAGQCVDLPAEVVVSPDLPPQYYGREVARYQVNVEFASG